MTMDVKDTTAEWRIIGEVCVDSGQIIIGDPCNADEAIDEWINKDIDLNECARKDIRTHQIANAVIAEAGLGDAVYTLRRVMKTWASGAGGLPR